MKKLFTLLTLLLTIVVGAKAADSDNVLIKTVDFSDDAWSSCRTAKVFKSSDGTIQGCTANADLIFTDDGEMNFNGSNMSDTGAKALLIPLENINGSIKVVITSTNSSSKVYYCVAEGTATASSRTATTAGETQTINYTMTTTETTGTLYIGRQGSKVDAKVTKIQVYTADASSVAAPTISFTSPNVTITCPTTGAKIYYTLDGTDPTDASTLYSDPFSIDADKVVKAIAYKAANNSEVVSKYCGLDKTFSTTTLIRFDDGNFTSPSGNLIEGITFGSDVSYQNSNVSVDGKSFTAGIQFGGGSYSANRFYSFKVAGACKVYIYGTSNGADVRGVLMKTGSMPSSATDGTNVGYNTGGYADMSCFDYTTDDETTIYIASRGVNFRIYAIKIVFGNENEYSLTIGDTGYASLSLPYAVSIPSGITAYTGAIGATSVALTEISDGVIPANTGVIITGTAGSYTFSETTSAGTAATELGNTAEGGLDISASEDTYYVLSKQGDDAVFAKVTNNTYKAIPSNKAYVRVAANNAPVLNIDFNNSNVTGIDEVIGQMEDVRGEYFNLAGQRVAQPQKGLYIVNGKKYIVK